MVAAALWHGMRATCHRDGVQLGDSIEMQIQIEILIRPMCSRRFASRCLRDPHLGAFAYAYSAVGLWSADLRADAWP